MTGCNLHVGRTCCRCANKIVRVQLAEDTNTIPAIATLFYRTRDYLNQEFWEDRAEAEAEANSDLFQPYS